MSPAKRSTANPQRRYNRDTNVMDAAIEIMSARGYAATSLQEVADKVGVLKGSLYHYFESKEELLFRILEESHQQNSSIIEDVGARELGPRDELLAYLAQSSRWYVNNVDRANIYFAESRHLTGQRLAEAQKHGRELEQYLDGLVRRGQELGEIRSDLDARLIVRYILSSINGVRSWPSRPGSHEFSVDEMVEAYVSMTGSCLSAPDRRHVREALRS